MATDSNVAIKLFKNSATEKAVGINVPYDTDVTDVSGYALYVNGAIYGVPYTTGNGKFLTSGTNVDTDLINGHTYYSSSSSATSNLTGTPPVTGSGFKIYQGTAYSTSRLFQIAIATSAIPYVRYKSSSTGAWGSWNQFAIVGHTHSTSDITSGTLDIARIPTGTTSSTVSLGNHTHNYAGSSSAGGAASKVAITNSTSFSGASYYLPFMTGTSGSQTLSANDYFAIYFSGTQTWFNTGKSGRFGGVTLWGGGSYYNNLSPNTSLTANRTITLPNADGTVSLEGHTHTNLVSHATLGPSSNTSHATSLKNYFDSYKSTAPRNGLICFYDSTNGNGSCTFGYFLNGHDSSPYGGFFSAHYNTPYYIGISNGTYTQWQLVKNDGGSWGISITGSSASCTGNATGLVDALNSSKTITAQYSGSGLTSASWFCVWDGYRIAPMNATYMRSSLGLITTSPTTGIGTTETTVTSDASVFSAFIASGVPGSSATSTCFIPKSTITSTAQEWQLTDEAHYIVFSLRISGSTLYAKVLRTNNGTKTISIAGLRGA